MTAAVVGVILNLALAFGATVIVLNSQIDVFALGLSVLFFALYFFKVDVLIVVIDGGLCGLIKYFLL